MADNPSSTKCSMCLESLETEPSTLFQLENCKHSFHFECIKKWCSENGKCPNCHLYVVIQDREKLHLKALPKTIVYKWLHALPPSYITHFGSMLQVTRFFYHLETVKCILPMKSTFDRIGVDFTVDEFYDRVLRLQPDSSTKMDDIIVQLTKLLEHAFYYLRFKFNYKFEKFLITWMNSRLIDDRLQLAIDLLGFETEEMRDELKGFDTNEWNDTLSAAEPTVTEICSVCHRPVEIESPVFFRLETCKHSFHVDCLQPWCMQSTNCFDCRVPIVDGDFAKLRSKFFLSKFFVDSLILPHSVSPTILDVTALSVRTMLMVARLFHFLPFVKLIGRLFPLVTDRWSGVDCTVKELYARADLLDSNRSLTQGMETLMRTLRRAPPELYDFLIRWMDPRNDQLQLVCDAFLTMPHVEPPPVEYRILYRSRSSSSECSDDEKSDSD